MKIKYNRTSTLNQTGNRFTADKEKYDLVLFDHGVSGKIPFKERENGKRLVELVKSKKVDEVVTEELSRLGRNTLDVLSNLQYFEENDVVVTVINMGNLKSHVNGKKNPIWNLITSVMSSLYELEREQILERTKIGREVYVYNGGRLGRPTGSSESNKLFLEKPKSQQIKSLIEKNKSVRDITGRLGVSSRTVTKVRKLLER